MEPERSEGIAALRRRGRMKQRRNFRSRAALRDEALRRDPQTANAARWIKSLLLRHKRTVILIEIAVLFFLCYDERRDESEGLSALLDDDW